MIWWEQLALPVSVFCGVIFWVLAGSAAVIWFLVCVGEALGKYK